MNARTEVSYTRELEVEVAHMYRRDMVRAMWPRIEHWIIDALAQSLQHELPIEQVWNSCLDGSYQVLVTRKGEEILGCAVLGKLMDPRDKPYIAVICCGGERVHEWLGVLVKAAKLIALQEGADQLVMMGRPGWRTLLQPLGCRMRAVVMALEARGDE